MPSIWRRRKKLGRTLESNQSAPEPAPVPPAPPDLAGPPGAELGLRRWRTWLESNFVFVCVYAPDGTLIAANPAALAAAGALPQEVLGQHLTRIAALAHSPESAELLRKLLERARGGETFRVEIPVRLQGGRLTSVDCVVCPLRDASGQIVEVATAAVEIRAGQQVETSLARINRELHMLSECTQAVVHAQSEGALLDSVCGILVRTGGYLLAWVGVADEDEARTVRPVARAGPDHGYLDAARVSWADNELGRGPTGRAVRERSVQICRDMDADPAMRPWREQAALHGYRSSIALPLITASQALGVLTIYCARPDAFDDPEVILLTELASELTYGIAALRADAERRQQQERIAGLARVLRMQAGINAAVLRISDPQELLSEACRVATDVGAYDRAVFSPVDADGRTARPQFRSGGGEDFPEPERLTVGDGTEADTSLSGRALRTGEITVCSDLSQSEPPVAMRKELQALGYRSLVALPLLTEGRRVGVLTLASKDANLLRDEELSLLQDIMKTLSAALRAQGHAEAAQFLASFDPLTGLAQRALLCERLDQVLRASTDPQRPPAVAVFDVHHLSHINDSYGRRVGDLVLRAVAERLKVHANSDEQIGYLGGGVFALIEPGLGASEGAIAAILDEEIFAERVAVEGRSLRLSYRSGVARFPVDGADGSTLLQRAEAAHKRAKEAGEPYLHYQLQMHSEIAERLELEHKLRAAIDERQFELWYQPQISYASGRVESVEALLRWRDPARGVVPPKGFLEVLESSGLIVPVGEWALGQVAADCERWSKIELPAFRIAVNVSALQLRRKSFVPSVLAVGKRIAACPGRGLDLEITESTLLQDLEGTSRKLRELRAANIRVALDDFGTGYSALGLLSKLPVDLVKIDRSFIEGLPDDPPSRLLVEAIVRLATGLGLATVAEGIESQAQFDTLRAMHCSLWQGYLRGPPVAREELERQLAG